MTVSVRFFKSFGTLFAAGLLLGSIAPSVLAFDPSARFSLAGQLGASSLAMGDVNDEIATARAYMRSEEWKVLDDIGRGFNYTVDLRADLFGPWMVSLGLVGLSGSSGVDFDQIISVEPSASVIQARLLYRLPWRPKPSIRLALGGGYLHANSGELKVSHEQRSVEAGTQRIESLTADLSGSGALGVLEAELLLNETFTIVGDVGYRYLNLSQDGYELTIENVDRPAIDGPDDDDVPEGRDLSDDSILRHSFIRNEERADQKDIDEFLVNDFKVDFSGIQANVGLRIYIF